MQMVYLIQRFVVFCPPHIAPVYNVNNCLLFLLSALFKRNVLDIILAFNVFLFILLM